MKNDCAAKPARRVCEDFHSDSFVQNGMAQHLIHLAGILLQTFPIQTGFQAPLARMTELLTVSRSKVQSKQQCFVLLTA